MSEGAQEPSALTPDGTATVLLCLAIEGRKATAGPRPLTVREYQGLARWLHREGLTPGTLLGAEGTRRLPQEMPEGPTRARVEELLARGLSLSVLLEKWAARGIRAVTRADAAYPEKLTSRLKAHRPPVLFVAGDLALSVRRSVAVVGSRDAEEAALDLTMRIGQWTAAKGLALVSGGARGIDSAAVLSALEAGGRAVAVLADSLSRAVLDGKYREALAEGRLLLATPYSPDAGFNVGNAMGRNKLVYALSDAAVVVSSAEGSGGTWAGATEALKSGWVPVFVDGRSGAPAGNRALLARGARPFSFEELERGVDRYETGAPVVGTGEEPDAVVAEPAAPPDKLEIESVFERVWPLLRSALTETLETADVARAIGVRSEQVLDWLKLAEKKGLARKRGRKWEVTAVLAERTGPAPGPATSGETPAFAAVRPVLERAVAIGLGPRKLAARLGVRLGQLQDWLEQMKSGAPQPVHPGSARKAKEQPGLFD